MKQICILKHTHHLNPGEIAGFDDAVADALISSGHAQECAPKAPPAPESPISPKAPVVTEELAAVEEPAAEAPDAAAKAGKKSTSKVEPE